MSAQPGRRAFDTVYRSDFPVHLSIPGHLGSGRHTRCSKRITTMATGGDTVHGNNVGADGPNLAVADTQPVDVTEPIFSHRGRSIQFDIGCSTGHADR